VRGSVNRGGLFEAPFVATSEGIAQPGVQNLAGGRFLRGVAAQGQYVGKLCSRAKSRLALADKGLPFVTALAGLKGILTEAGWSAQSCVGQRRRKAASSGCAHALRRLKERSWAKSEPCWQAVEMYFFW